MSDTTASSDNPIADTGRRAGRVDHWQRIVEWTIAGVNFLAVLAGLAICVGVDGDFRLPLAAFLVLLGPGSGLVQLLGAFDTTVRLVLVVGLSLATSVLVAQVLLTFGIMGSLQAAIPLTVISGLGILLRLVRLAGSDDEKEDA